MAYEFKIEFDFNVSVDSAVESIKNEAGVYILFDEYEKPLYVGRSSDVKSRVLDHLTGITNTKNFHLRIKKIAGLYIKDNHDRVLIESYFIYKYKKETSNIYDLFSNQIKFGEKMYPNANKIFGKCKAYKVNGEPCRKYAHSNGACAIHGGNGLSGTALIGVLVEDYLSGKYKPDINKID